LPAGDPSRGPRPPGTPATPARIGRAEQRLDHVVDEIQERVLAPLSQNERRQLTKLLRKLADAD
jgi:hypothetical protein